MSKVSIASVREAPVTGPPPGISGQAETRPLFEGSADPIHAHLHRVAQGGVVRIGPMDMDCVVYVWTGAVEAGGREMAASSSLVVERGAAVAVKGVDASSQILTFHAQEASAAPRAGGHVHLLPTERVKRAEMGAPGVVGGMHANAQCPTCAVWLHENSMPGREQTPEDAARGVHSHTEDEVIFVVEGEMRFGTQVLTPGMAVAIQANAFYGFGTGPKGLKFVNFRAGLPTEIRFKKGGTMDEPTLWREFGQPAYLEPLAG